MQKATERPTNKTLRGWAIAVLREVGAITECEEHGWMQDKTDPHARERAFAIASQDPPQGVSPKAASVVRRSPAKSDRSSASSP
jgi:hypothetical protein